MQEVSKKIRVTHRVNDHSLDINRLNEYELFLSIEDKNLRVTVIDSQENRCLLLEDYRFSGITARQDTLEQLTNILENHFVLKANYWKNVTLVARNGCFLLVPNECYDKDYLYTYLELYPNNLDNSEIKTYFHKNYQLHSIFRVESDFIEWVKKSYFHKKEIQIIHQVDAFLEGVLREETSQPTIFIYIESKYMNMIVVQYSKLLLCNRYYYQSPQDFVYFVLFAIDELQFNPEICQVKLYGEISKDSGIYNLLQKYVRHVVFGKRPTNLSFSYAFEEIIEHRYFDLYNAHYCLQV